MIYKLPSNVLYGNEAISLEMPEHWEVHISQIKGFRAPALTREQILSRINSPIGAEPICRGARGKKSAVIIIDDITRPTPCREIAETVLSQLSEAGVPKNNRWFIAALGAHGTMYREDFIRKLGEKIVEEYEVYNHNAFYNHDFLGVTDNGIPIEINSDVMRAEYKIAIGTMMPHSFYGFSGGAKSILPGIASIKTIVENHKFTSPKEFNMGNRKTLIREDAEQAARMMGLDYKIDVILNGKAEMAELYCGDFEEEAKEARLFASRHYMAEFVPDCDIVISNSYFKPLEAGCAYTPETIESLKQGGSYVLAANSPYGVCVHYLYDKWGHTAPGGVLYAGLYEPSEKMDEMIVFSQYTVKGMRDSWFIDESKGAKYCSRWRDVLVLLDDGREKKVAVYPMADSQILDNSLKYYTSMG